MSGDQSNIEISAVGAFFRIQYYLEYNILLYAVIKGVASRNPTRWGIRQTHLPMVR
jgi:hypothetical protein